MRTSYIIWIAEDWDNEEYTGSLADSKVFTPSSGPEPSQQPVPENAVDGAMPLLDQSQPLTLDMQPPSRPPQMPPVSHVSLQYLTLDLKMVQFIFSAKESKSNDGRRIWNPLWINYDRVKIDFVMTLCLWSLLRGGAKITVDWLICLSIYYCNKQLFWSPTSSATL